MIWLLCLQKEEKLDFVNKKYYFSFNFIKHDVKYKWKSFLSGYMNRAWQQHILFLREKGFPFYTIRIVRKENFAFNLQIGYTIKIRH